MVRVLVFGEHLTDVGVPGDVEGGGAGLEGGHVGLKLENVVIK